MEIERDALKVKVQKFDKFDEIQSKYQQLNV